MMQIKSRAMSIYSADHEKLVLSILLSVISAKESREVSICMIL